LRLSHSLGRKPIHWAIGIRWAKPDGFGSPVDTLTERGGQRLETRASAGVVDAGGLVGTVPSHQG
jgi:hypothetical protein